jgi:hypothetical protein
MLIIAVAAAGETPRLWWSFLFLVRSQRALTKYRRCCGRRVLALKNEAIDGPRPSFWVGWVIRWARLWMDGTLAI